MNIVIPVLLLDDVFDKFDETRVRQIIAIVAGSRFGQIFITHTDEHKMKAILEEMNTGYRMFRISKENIDII